MAQDNKVVPNGVKKSDLDYAETVVEQCRMKFLEADDIVAEGKRKLAKLNQQRESRPLVSRTPEV